MERNVVLEKYTHNIRIKYEKQIKLHYAALLFLINSALQDYFLTENTKLFNLFGIFGVVEA
jgi:hypothetical protein